MKTKYSTCVCLLSFHFILCGLLLCFACTLPAQAAPLQQLHGHVQAAWVRMQPLRELPGTNRLSLAIGLPLRNQANLDALLKQILDPASPNYHHYLTLAQFTARFGPSERDYQAVVAFAETNNAAYVANFWKFYAPRYANDTRVLYEIQNESVAWGPPYSSANATPPGAVNMEEAAYSVIRQYAANTPVLLFTYAVFGGDRRSLRVA